MARYKQAWQSALNLFLCGLLITSRCAAQTRSVSEPLAEAKSKKAVVLFFIGHDCPISNAYAPEIKRICARYAPQRIGFYMVYPDPDLSFAAAQKHAKDYGYTAPVLLDANHRLSRKAGATVTPEAAVLAPDGKLLYRGRIDDLYIGFGKQRYEATQHDLRNALDAIAQGKSVPLPFTRAIGCFIPDVGPDAHSPGRQTRR